MPAGLVGDDDASDTLESAARRELIEETGWDAARIDVLLVGPTTAGMSNERIAFARARDLTRVGDGGGVDAENITVHSIPRAQAPARSEERRAGNEGVSTCRSRCSAHHDKQTHTAYHRRCPLDENRVKQTSTQK